MARSNVVGFFTEDGKRKPISAPTYRSRYHKMSFHTQLSLDQFKDAKITAKDGAIVVDQSKSLGPVLARNVETGEVKPMPLTVKKNVIIHPPSPDDSTRYIPEYSPAKENKMIAELDYLISSKQAINSLMRPGCMDDPETRKKLDELYAQRAKVMDSLFAGRHWKERNHWVLRDGEAAYRFADTIADMHGGCEIFPLPDPKDPGSIWGYLVWTKGYYGYMGG